MADKEIIWDEKTEKVKEALKASFWGDFLFGGLVVSGIFIFIESLELPSYVNVSIGISLFLFAIFLIFSRYIYFRIRKNLIEKVIGKTANSETPRESLVLLNKLLEDKRNLKIKEIWNNKGITLYNLARYEEALESFNYAIEINPFYKFSLLNKGATLGIFKRFDAELECYNKVLALDQNYKLAWYNKGNVLRDLKRYEEALGSYDKALALDQNYVEAWNNRGIILGILERYEEALESFNRALTLDQNHIKAWYNKGNVLRFLKQYEEALGSYDKALALDQNYVEVWYNNARIYSLLNVKDKAIKHLKKAVNLNNKYKENAKSDKDFDNIRDSQEFKELIED